MVHPIQNVYQSGYVQRLQVAERAIDLCAALEVGDIGGRLENDNYKQATGGTMPTSPRAANGEPYDVTIVGAGMAGLYSAWRLLSQVPQPRLCFLEESNRVGGRLDSYTFTDRGADVTVELGGMRFQDSMALVAKLVSRLKLATASFPLSSNRLFYLRGMPIWEKEITEQPPVPVSLPYRLPQSLLNKTADQLFNWAVSRAVGNSNAWNWSTEQWKAYVLANTYTSPPGKRQAFKNVKFWDVGFWNLLYDQVGDEGYRYLTDAGGYDSNTINWNSALAMPYVASGDYASSAKYLKLVDGYSALPRALAQAIEEKLAIQFCTRLVGFTKDGTGLLNLSINNEDSGPATIQTKSLMLCMPRRSLELLDPDIEFSTYLRDFGLIDSVLRQPSFKLLMLFDQEWWKQVKIRGYTLQRYGPTITDLPLRMIWYFDDLKMHYNDGRQAPANYWALLASYSDMVTEQFWKGLETLVPGSSPSAPVIPAPPEMVNMALDQLERVHGMPIPQPVAAVFKDWGADPFGAGYHAWAVGPQPWDTYVRMFHPMDSYQVYICGEAYSLDQGWVEGALRTAETVLLKYFGIPPLEGVHPDYVKSGARHHGY